MSARAASVGPVRVATWNVNSVKQRVPRLLPWLDQRQPDVVCLQETKLADGAFTELLGFKLLPRLKNIGAIQLYAPGADLAAWPRREKIVKKRPITCHPP